MVGGDVAPMDGAEDVEPEVVVPVLPPGWKEREASFTTLLLPNLIEFLHFPPLLVGKVTPVPAVDEGDVHIGVEGVAPPAGISGRMVGSRKELVVLQTGTFNLHDVAPGMDDGVAPVEEVPGRPEAAPQVPHDPEDVAPPGGLVSEPKEERARCSR